MNEESINYESRDDGSVPMANRVCPKCAGSMACGYILDRGDGGTQLQSVWLEGLPKKSFLRGTKTKGRKRVPILTFRCRKCGFLESFAMEA